MTLQELNAKYGKVGVLLDLNKNLMQVCFASGVSNSVFVSPDSLFDINFELNKHTIRVWGYRDSDTVNVSVDNEPDGVVVPVENKNIYYDTKSNGMAIDGLISKMKETENAVVTHIVTYLSQVRVVYTSPCFIIDPFNDNQVPVKAITKGRVICDTGTDESLSYSIDQLDSDSVFLLWDALMQDARGQLIV